MFKTYIYVNIFLGVFPFYAAYLFLSRFYEIKEFKLWSLDRYRDLQREIYRKQPKPVNYLVCPDIFMTWRVSQYK